MRREYGIGPGEALTEYTEEQIQDLLSQLPVERIVTVQQGMNKQQIENRYLESFMDRDISNLMNAEEKFKLYDERANLKAQLRAANTPEEKSRLNKKLEEVSEKIGEK